MADNLIGLIDQYGQPIPRQALARLGEDEAAPSSESARPPFVGHLATNIHPQQMGRIIRAADMGQTREWFILAEEIEEMFSHYLAVLSKRKRQVCGLPITVDPAKNLPDADRHADFIRTWLEDGVLEHALFDMTDALGKGFSISELIWQTTDDGIVPAHIHWRNQRDFEVSWKDGHTLWLRTDSGFADLFPHKFMVHKHTLKSGSPVRSGLTRAVAWLWMFSIYTLKDWALFVQGYGLPVRVGRYGPSASEGDKRTLWRALRGIAGDLAAIIPDSMKIEFVESKAASEGAKLYEGRATWLNAEVSKLVLGGVAGTDAVAGSHAVGKDHRAAEQDVEKFDARLLAHTVNRKLIQTIIAFNFGPQKAYPRVVIGQEERVPVSDMVAAAADLGPLGFRARAQDFYDRLQMNKPEDGDEVIGAPVVAPGTPGAPKISANPHPEINPNSDARAMMSAGRNGRGLLGRLVLQTAQPERLMEALEERLSREAGATLAEMTAKVRQCAEVAEDMPDLARRLAELELNPHDFAVAMAQGMALAHLAGQANVLDELR